jgi:hypothetical protein
MSEPSPQETRRPGHCSVVLNMDAVFSFGVFRFSKPVCQYNVP